MISYHTHCIFAPLLISDCLYFSLSTAPHKHPRIIEHPTNVVVKMNEAATLTCKASGKPPPQIEWFKDGEKLTVTDNRVILPNGSLYFLHARVSQENDTGTYFCVARNDVGRVKSQTAVLEVSGGGVGSGKLFSSCF